MDFRRKQPLCPLCEAIFPLSSPDEEDHFHHRRAGGDRPLFAGGAGRVAGVLRWPGPG